MCCWAKAALSAKLTGNFQWRSIPFFFLTTKSLIWLEGGGEGNCSAAKTDKRTNWWFQVFFVCFFTSAATETCCDTKWKECQYFLIVAIIIRASSIFLHLPKVYLDLGSCKPISPSSLFFIKINASRGWDMEEKLCVCVCVMWCWYVLDRVPQKGYCVA